LKLGVSRYENRILHPSMMLDGLANFNALLFFATNKAVLFVTARMSGEGRMTPR
jgi:hypothetical protein